MASLTKQYNQWEKFNSEEEISKLENQEEREKKQLVYLKYEKEKSKLEIEASQQAAALKSQSSVAVLRAKQQQKKLSQYSENSNLEAIELLERKAKLYSLESKGLDCILAFRNEGQDFYKRQKYNEAMKCYESALKELNKLEEILSDILKLNSVYSEGATLPCCQHHNEASKDKEQKHSCNHQCINKSNKDFLALPTSTDHSGVLKILWRDCLVGKGKCQYQIGQYASSTESYKQVLLKDRLCIEAWIERGKTFQKIGLPMLSLLHYNQVLQLDPEHDETKDQIHLIQVDIDKLNDRSAEDLEKEEEKRLLSNNMKERIDAIIELRQEADIFMTEAFYSSAIVKYKVVLKGLDEISELLLKKPTKVSDDAIKQNRLSCYLNIATAYLNLQKHYSKAIHYCQSSLAIAEDHPLALFRLAQAYHFSHKFSSALEVFTKLERISLSSSELATLKQHIDKCKYDQAHLDPVYIQKELSKTE